MDDTLHAPICYGLRSLAHRCTTYAIHTMTTMVNNAVVICGVSNRDEPSPRRWVGCCTSGGVSSGGSRRYHSARRLARVRLPWPALPSHPYFVKVVGEGQVFPLKAVTDQCQEH